MASNAFHRSMTQLFTWRPAVQLVLCLVLANRGSPTASLPLQVSLTLLFYVSISAFLVLPLRLFVYLPFLSPLRGIPSPPSGHNTWRTWLAKEPTPPQLLDWVKVTKREHGDSFRGVMRYIGIGGGERVLISSPESLKEVLVTQQYKFFDRPTMARKRIAMQARNRLITSSGEVHKQQKRKLTPAFSSRAIKELHPLYWSKANELAEAISKRIQSSDSASIDILSWTSRSALDIIGTAAWGQDFNAISEPDSDFLKTYSAMFDISGGGPLMSALALAIPMSYLLYIPVPYNKRLRAALKAIRTRCTHAVKEKKQMALEGKDTYKDILSLLIQGGIEDEEALINQMMTILAAGHDTSSLSLAWGLYLLCKYPDVQTKLREELRSQLPLGSYGSTDEIIPEMLEDLPYLSAVANEILRLMPSVHTTRREALNDTTVEGYFIPRDGHMVISGWVCNRLELEWGTDAEQFVPDRWLNTGKDEDSSTSVNNKFAFNSFSHGARSCIGQGFARGEFLVFLATLVGCFEMELEDPSKEPVALFGITMSPAEEIRIKFTQVI